MTWPTRLPFNRTVRFTACKFDDLWTFAEATHEIPPHQVGVPGPEASHRDCRAPVTTDTRCHGRHYQLQRLPVKDEQKVPPLEQTMVRLRPKEKDPVVLQRQLVQEGSWSDLLPGRV